MPRLTLLILLLPLATASAESLLPPNWDAKQAGDQVLAGLIQVTAPQVKGAHDAEMAITNGRAFVVAEVNDDRAGEGAGWPNIYSAISTSRQTARNASCSASWSERPRRQSVMAS